MNENQISQIIVDCSVKIHKRLGPGLFESVYEAALCYEFEKRSLAYLRQPYIKIQYEELTIDHGFKADMIVENKVIIELKSVEVLNGVHKKQLITYLKLSGLKLGLLLNFNVYLMKNGIVRIVNDL